MLVEFVDSEIKDFRVPRNPKRISLMFKNYPSGILSVKNHLHMLALTAACHPSLMVDEVHNFTQLGKFYFPWVVFDK